MTCLRLPAAHAALRRRPGPAAPARGARALAPRRPASSLHDVLTTPPGGEGDEGKPWARRRLEAIPRPAETLGDSTVDGLGNLQTVVAELSKRQLESLSRDIVSLHGAPRAVSNNRLERFSAV